MSETLRQENADDLRARRARASQKAPPSTPNTGSRFVSVGPVTIGCMALESRDAMDLALERYRNHAAGMKANQGYVSDDPVYSFAYWLFRWSGIVSAVNLDTPANPFSERER